MTQPHVPDFVVPMLADLGIELPEPTLQQLARYLDLLLEANRQFNLTAIKDPDQAWRRHIIDSLTILPGLADLPEKACVIDVGSGGGLPGIPVAISRPDLQVALLEATGKKARFLEQCARQLSLSNVRVVNQRAETAGRDSAHRQRYDLAICRAVGPMRELLEYTLPLVKEGGRLIAMKGPSVAEELDHAGDALDILGAGELEIVEAYPEGFEQNTVLVIIRKERPTPAAYPRLPGTPRHDPL